MEIQSVGIVGAGQMGNGIAHVFAMAGYDVLLNDVNADSREIRRCDQSVYRAHGQLHRRRGRWICCD